MRFMMMVILVFLALGSLLASAATPAAKPSNNTDPPETTTATSAATPSNRPETTNATYNPATPAATPSKDTTPQKTTTATHKAPPNSNDPPHCGTPVGPPTNGTCFVNCNDRMDSCTCPEEYERCTFLLVVEALQTFTSYKLVPQYEDALQFHQDRLHTRGTILSSAGDTYYIDGNGYTPTLPPFSPQNSSHRPMEYGDCYGKQFPDDSSNCSVPVTVDGTTFRMFIGVNGKIPGPTLVVREGQTVKVRVWNKLLSQGISIHWHGLYQRRTPWMDGVQFLTQPPIVPGAHFDYIFEAYPPGTHWYHSHTGPQRTDGLYGALVVMEKTTTLAYGDNRDIINRPEDFTLTLHDWQLESSLNLFVKMHGNLGFFPDVGEGRVPTQQDRLYRPTHSGDGVAISLLPFWSGLINGKGRHTPDTFSILSVFNVEAGNSYRFRVIGVQSIFAFKLSIEGHKLDVIATDGHFIETETADYIIVHTGERYDFVLHADQRPDNYWIRAETLETDATGQDAHTAEAILHYNTQGVAEPDYRNKYSDVLRRERKCTRHGCVAINCPFQAYPPTMKTRCLPLDQLKARPPPHKTPLPKMLTNPNDPNLKFLNFGFQGEHFSSSINAINFRLPTIPYQTYCQQSSSDKNLVCDEVRDGKESDLCIHVEKIASNTKYDEKKAFPSVNFVLSNIGPGHFAHPIHLHGHSFYVVAVEHGVYDKDEKLANSSSDITCDDLTHCRKPRWAGPWGRMPQKIRQKFRTHALETAIRKDTVIVPAGGYVVIAFAADNPGYWFMHCHIESHQLEGMALIVQEYDTEYQWAPPDGVVNSIEHVNINKIGDFTWATEDYKTFVDLGRMCSRKN